MNVYITGIGVCTSVGTTVEETWKKILLGKHGTKKISKFPNLELNACEIPNIRGLNCNFSHKDDIGNATKLFLKTAEEAIQDAELEINDNAKIGLAIGTTMGEIDCLEERLLNKSFHAKFQGGPDTIANQSYKLLNLNGPSWTITNACAAGNIAISRAMDEIFYQHADVMIAGGVDVLSWVAIHGFRSLKAMSPDLCTPFDKERKGLILGEGAGVLILESERHLMKRTKLPRAKLLGYGLSSDAHHITQPDPNGLGANNAMKSAIKMAGISVEDIQYVSAHGTGTAANDLMEAKAIKAVFNHTNPYVSSIKGQIGHTLGGASAIEAALCVQAINTNTLPPNIHLKNQDPEIKLNVIKNSPVKTHVDHMMSNAYAFGGVNTSIIIGRP
ncbi:beta-ketoacyl-[acyl-carrier-protein] synthase family protein [Chengkuizengella sediminis]|uniref:beta-ketoacyl-[acyl-carrier-protein] synthase family protein n=1 Tax=Chengkuizengella sediminis TaxID=1885917 RepID=UPI001389B103|nr:beta-ketoacyl-[acyl-carrier-protein] synthase family protein [Chengkuizengella sediminis]NDI35943.1 beta-ketoacyl-[acyl-carrier-protein] synthase family protein [Chengkuizengella sediminis]